MQSLHNLDEAAACLRRMVKIDSGDLEEFYPTPWGASMWGTLRVWRGSDLTGDQPRKGAVQCPQIYVPLKFSSLLFRSFVFSQGKRAHLNS